MVEPLLVWSRECDQYPYVCLLQAEQDAGSKDKELNEALERMRQYEAVS